MFLCTAGGHVSAATWIGVTLAMAASGAVGFGIGWLFGDDHGRETTNRQWIDAKDPKWDKIVYLGNAPKGTA